MDLNKKIINKIRPLKNYDKLYNIPWELYFNKRCNNCGKNLNILILNAPCNGFGDLIFAYKFANYLRNWYGSKVDIATPLAEGLIKLGGEKNSIIKLEGKYNDQCRRFASFKTKYFKNSKQKLEKYDLIFVAPVASDFEISRQDIKKLIPYSNLFNTFFLSEYNDSTHKNFDFDTGVGKNRYGLLLTDEKNIKPSKKIKNKYALAYIADIEDSSIKCFINFLLMISKKYHKKYKKI